MADSGLVFTVDGKRYELNVEEITGTDAQAFRAATGSPFRQTLKLFTESPDDIDLDTIAGVVWLARRQAGDRVAFDEVLGSITYASDFSTEVAEVDPPQQ